MLYDYDPLRIRHIPKGDLDAVQTIIRGYHSAHKDLADFAERTDRHDILQLFEGTPFAQFCDRFARKKKVPDFLLAEDLVEDVIAASKTLAPEIVFSLAGMADEAYSDVEHAICEILGVRELNASYRAWEDLANLADLAAALDSVKKLEGIAHLPNGVHKDAVFLPIMAEYTRFEQTALDLEKEHLAHFDELTKQQQIDMIANTLAVKSEILCKDTVRAMQDLVAWGEAVHRNSFQTIIKELQDAVGHDGPDLAKELAS